MVIIVSKQKQISNPYGLVGVGELDGIASNMMYVSKYGNHCVSVFTSEGVIWKEGGSSIVLVD